MSKITLLTGGARSGKSTHALKLAGLYQRKFFIATGEALDEEMTARIKFHRETRPSDFQTIEEPVNVARELEVMESGAEVVVIDCLTLWISNLMHIHRDDESILAEADALAAALKNASFASIVVTDEVGMGMVPMHPIERRYRDLLGWTNQKIAGVADEVLLMVAGYPLRVK
jgi:adenosylcobinamide kinase / adenosylcobinamide-phosphate guanylyltransferase